MDTARLGTLSALGLAASGVGIALQPRQASASLDIPAISQRGIAETRAGLGGTYAALGTWSALRATPDAHTAVGMTWLGAAALRLVSLVVDKPRTSPTFWLYLAGELTLGTCGVAAGRAPAAR